MKITLITHLSQQFPLYVADLIAAFENCISDEHVLYKKLLSSSAEESEVIDNVQIACLEGCDLIVLYSNLSTLNKAEQMTCKLGKKIILLDSSATLGDYNNGNHSYWISMQLAESLGCLLLIKKLNQNEKLISLIDSIESGYQNTRYFFNGIKNTKIEPLSMVVQQPNKPVELAYSKAREAIIECRPTSVMISAIGDEGKAFYHLIKDSEIKEKHGHLKWCLHPLLVAQLLENNESLESNTIACATWHKYLPSAKDFVHDFQEKHQRSPSFFACIGHEAALVVNSLPQGKSGNIVSPRGELKWNEMQRRYFAPQYYIHGKQRDEKVNNIDEVRIEINEIDNLLKKEFVSGWGNPYLCL